MILHLEELQSHGGVRLQLTFGCLAPRHLLADLAQQPVKHARHLAKVEIAQLAEDVVAVRGKGNLGRAFIAGDALVHLESNRQKNGVEDRSRVCLLKYR